MSKLDELLKLAREEGNAEPLSGFERFVLEKPVVKYHHPKVTTERAFYHYLLFCRDNNIIPLNKYDFGRQMSAAGHPSKADNFDRKHYINPEPFHMTEEEELAMKTARREWEKNLLIVKPMLDGYLASLKRRKAARLKAAKLARLKERLRKKHGATLTKIEDSKSDSSPKSSKNTTT